jgi:hypothetical protein
MTQISSEVLRGKLPPVGFFGIDLRKGSHSSRERGVCAMEAAAWLAGEPHSDKPQCACSVIGAFVIAWNDALPTDEDRNRLLKPLIPRLIGTASTQAVRERRSYLALDWLIRVQTPAWLALRDDLKPHADTLRALSAITDPKTAKAANAAVTAARDAAWDAAWAAARAAAWAAARAAAWDAARDAAWDAAWAAARDAAWDAAGDAAWDAAGDAAWAALAPTVRELQGSALGLFERMIGDAGAAA